MSFSGGKGEEINLLYQLIICRVTRGSLGTQGWHVGPTEALAGKATWVYCLQHHPQSSKWPGKQTWATRGSTWNSVKWALGRWARQGFRRDGSVDHLCHWQWASLEGWEQGTLLGSAWGLEEALFVIPQIIISKCYYPQMLLLTACSD